MATQFDYKRKSLESIIEGLQCFKCKGVPGFTQEQQNRYSCFNKSHQLCEICKAICECGSPVGKHPNPATKQILKDLPVYCPHYKNECREIFLQAESLDDHQKGCVFRQIGCPDLPCKEKILFKDVIKHLKQIHGNRYWFVATENKHTVKLGTDSNIKDGSTWPPQGIKINSGVDLFLVGKIIHKVAYFWLYVMSSPLEAKKYSYTLSVTGKNGNKFSIFHAYPKPLDEGHEQIIENQPVFMIGTEVIKTISEKNVLKIEVTIHDLKEEAKDDDEESGVEDESD